MTPPPSVAPQKMPKIMPQPILGPADLNAARYGGISRARAHMIKTGRIRPTARLDLHGLSRTEAQRRLESFLIISALEGHRVVLIITGKGVAGQGILRRNLPVWLSFPPLAGRIIAYCQAQKKDGGAGAFYVNLRKS